jgi:riboflavin kinase/FMN adenylyltransferase
MDVFRDPWKAGQFLQRPVVALGNFDGVHLGHRHVFRSAIELAKHNEKPWAVVTFDPHPAKVLAPELAPQLITTIENRLRLISESGPAATVVLDFNKELAKLTPTEFAQHILIERLNVAGVVVGYDFTFGSHRSGSIHTLRDLGKRFNFDVKVVDPYAVGGIVISSTKVRAYVLAGRVFAASLLLGRPLVLSGEVVHGDGRGRKLGYPTANIHAVQELTPAPGVYAGWCSFEDNHFPAAINVGSVPTFRTHGRTSVEAFILDWSGDLYGASIEVEFIRRLRPEHRYDSAEKLVDQIEKDVMRTREILLKL